MKLERRFHRFGRRKSDFWLRVTVFTLIVVILALLNSMLTGCVRYVHEDAEYYHALYLSCKEDRKELVEGLEKCIEVGSELDSWLQP